MPWMSLLSGVLKLGGVLARICEQKGLMNAGEAKAVAKANADALDRVNRAWAARRGVDHSSDAVRDDPDRRD
jgi:hypothetical protein